MSKLCNFKEFIRLAKIRQAQGEHSVIRQLLELLVLFPFYRVGPGFYQMAGFWKRTIPWSDKKGHLNPSAYRKIIGKLNPLPYRKLSENKLSETAILRLFKIPTPEYLGYYNEFAGCDASGSKLCSLKDFRSFLEGFQDQTKICFKQLEGWAGQGFEVAEVRKCEDAINLFRMKTQSLMTLNQFIDEVIDKQHGGSSIIEAYLKQHPALASFNATSVNTMRLWIARMPRGEPKVMLGYLRIGRENSLVDNQSSGGIVAPIELDTGKLCAAIDGLCQHNVFKKHPDHNAVIEGESIPCFKDSLALARQVLIAFPGIRFAGADVAVSNEGPQIIEINLSPDREGAAFAGIPTKNLLTNLADSIR